MFGSLDWAETAEQTALSMEELKKQLAAAPQLTVEELGQPVRTIRQGMLLKAPNPDGKTWDLVQIYFPHYGGQNTLVFIDTGTGQIKTLTTEPGWNFHLCPGVVAPNGKLFISILDGKLRQRICIYDPASNQFYLDAVRMPEELLGETHPLVLGTDGKLYAIGSHPSRAAAAARIDPDTLEVTFYGPIGPSHAPHGCWGYSGGADDRFIYIASGKVPWYLVAFDRQTGRSEVLATTGPVGGYVSVSQLADGCTASVTGQLQTDGQRIDYWLHQGKAIRKTNPNEAPPWSARKPLVTFPPEPELNLAYAEPDPEGWAEIRVRLEGTWKSFRFQTPLYPLDIYRLRELPDGQLFGTAGAYEGNFIVEPTTGKARHLGKIPLSHYATAIHDGLIYMSGYPTSPLYVYDPKKPWTTGTVEADQRISEKDPSANPKFLMYLGDKKMAGTHKMYAAAVGADGKIYFGGRWMRDGSAGGLAWYDPKTGQAGGTWQPFSTYQITHLAAVEGGRKLVISTVAVSDPLLGKPKPSEAALLFWDVEKQQIVGQFTPVPQVQGTGPIVAAGENRIVGWTVEPDQPEASRLYGVETTAPRLVWSRQLAWRLPVGLGSNQQEPWDFRLGPDGHVWTFLAGCLVRIDPADGRIHPVGKLSPGGPIAFAGKDLYLGGTATLRRIRNLLSQSP
ncbi:MAG: hypothetical protein NZ602_02860 [Thermoguttaceae bacterium]|nr:hypothetical protein [Thermoguttaceae bacterium]MDW8039112.1 hypothetical protein [Thermoguttaceae bacterium]